MEQIGTEKNIFYNKEFMDIILNKYLPFCSLYTGLMLNNSPVSNALVENYFGQLKQITLEGQKNLKCSQFVRKLREDVVSTKTEVDIGIRKSRLTKPTHLMKNVLRNAGRKER
ncbi:hypothetical protein QE152_g26948 [Popillia japonica]|uniref:Uncharacterized protein n=1 Tax=Popillia japonica TaxID=7064 RepID=A0AAW1JX58_POPJA